LEDNTLRREISPIEKKTNHHQKILLTFDETGAGASHSGIRQLNRFVLDAGERFRKTHRIT